MLYKSTWVFCCLPADHGEGGMGLHPASTLLPQAPFPRSGRLFHPLPGPLLPVAETPLTPGLQSHVGEGELAAAVGIQMAPTSSLALQGCGACYVWSVADMLQQQEAGLSGAKMTWRGPTFWPRLLVPAQGRAQLRPSMSLPSPPRVGWSPAQARGCLPVCPSAHLPPCTWASLCLPFCTPPLPCSVPRDQTEAAVGKIQFHLTN